MKYFSIFSGIGGFEYGIQNNFLQSGQDREENKLSFEEREYSEQPQRTVRQSTPICIGFSEIDKYATQIYKKHFKHKEYGDVSRIEWNDVEDFDLLCGGFPCQAFSIAGKRGGFRDTRGTLFFEIARCLREKQPRLLLLENVKGLLSHDKGRTFGVILNTLDELGYDLQWQVLNSKNFGVPQNRERVFIIGHLRGTGRPQVFPIGETDQTHNREVANCIDSNYHKGWLDHKQRTMVKVHDEITMVASNQKNAAVMKNISPTIPSSSHGSHPPYIVGTKIRRLTPTECERLQSFPDGWTEGISDTQRYKCLGNAVTTNVIQAIMEKLL